MTALALDLGQHIGWIKGAAVGPLEHGTFDLPETTDLGAWLASTDAFFPEVMAGVTSIAAEQPFLGASYYPARKLLALLGHVYHHAHYQGIGAKQVDEIPVATGKVTLSGRGNAEAPEMVAAACEFFGFEPEEIDEHQAHAAGIFKVHIFGRTPARPSHRPRSSPGRVIGR